MPPLPAGTLPVPTFPIGFATGAGTVSSAYLTAVKLIGAQHVRTGIKWDSLDTNLDGTVDNWTPLDNFISNVAAAGLKIIVQLAVPSTSPNMNDPVIAAKFATFCANVAEHLNGNTTVMCIEIGNEVNTGPWSGDIPGSAGGHGKLRGLDYAEIIIRLFGQTNMGFEHVQGRTDRKIIIGSMVRGNPNGHEYINALAMYQQMYGYTVDTTVSGTQPPIVDHPGITVGSHNFPDGIKDLPFDGVTFHTYDEGGYASGSETQADGTGLMIDTMEWLFATYAFTPKVWITERGRPTWNASDQTFDTPTLLANQQADILDMVTTYNALFAARGWDLKGLSYFTFMDKPLTLPEAKDYHWGLVHYGTTFPIPDADKKPAYFTFESVMAPAGSNPPPDVANFAGTSSDTQVTLAWTQPAGNTAHTDIYRDSGGGFVFLASVLVTDPPTYVDAGLVNGQHYGYKARNVSTDNVNGNFTTPITITPVAGTDTTPPPVPTANTGSAGDGQAVLSWGAVLVTDLASYKVYQSISGTYTLIITLAVIVPGDPTSAPTSYIVSGLTNGTEYSFKVSAVDETGNESAKSSVIFVTPQQAEENNNNIPDPLYYTLSDTLDEAYT